jgi:hypothetical protein
MHEQEVALINDDITDDTGAYSSAMSEDGDSAFPTKQGKDDDEAAQKDLDDVHEHADPSKGDKVAESGDRVKTDGPTRGAADEQVMKAERSI